MPFHSHVPAAPLGELVDLMWIAETYSAPHSRERVLPTGAMDLVIGLNDDKAIGAAIAGARSESFVLDTSKTFSLIGIRFAIGGGGAFFDPPADELHNIATPLDSLWGRAFVASVRDQLLEAGSPAARFQILERALLSQLRRRWTHPAVFSALRAFSAATLPTVGAVTEQIGLSRRRFAQVFRNQVGLTPKLLCRIKRFQRVLDAVDTSRDIDWSDTALRCGYYDQAHFIHDFRRFSGLSPTAYLEGRIHRHHVPILE